MTKDLEQELIEPDLNAVTYSSYLKVNELLDLQTPLTTPKEHDEILFIIIHQVYELWFKQILHEVGYGASALRDGQIMHFVRNCKRVNTIQKVLTHQVDVLETMTPVEFNRFREKLNPASGFQSVQFRLLEFKLGARESAYLKFHKHNHEAHENLTAALSGPTLYDDFLFAMNKRGVAIPAEVLNRDTSKAYSPNAEVQEAILKVYRNPDEYYDLYLAMEALLDMDEEILLWRYRHVAMVERMIGTRRGTGGSSGAKYLSSTLSKRFFPDLWEVRNEMGLAPYGADKN